MRHLERKLRFWHLRVMAQVCESRSLAKAALTLGVTQSALTRTVRELESLCGGKLFSRHARGTTPSPLGLEFLDCAREILGELSEFRGKLDHSIRLPRSSIRIGASAAAVAGLLPTLVARLGTRVRPFEVQIVEGPVRELTWQLRAGELELIVGRLDEAPGHKVAGETLYQETLAVVARRGHPALRAGSMIHATLEQVARYPLVLPTHLLGTELDRVLQALPRSAAPALRTNCSAALRELLESGEHVAVLPRVAMAGELMRGACMARSLPFLPAHPAGVVRRARGELSTEGALFLETLRSHVQDVMRRIGEPQRSPEAHAA
jgi:DNA-binding transcriptional LysR family regulator